MAFDFLQPLDESFLEFIQGLSPQTLGKKVVFHTDAEFPNIEKWVVEVESTDGYFKQMEGAYP